MLVKNGKSAKNVIGKRFIKRPQLVEQFTVSGRPAAGRGRDHLDRVTRSTKADRSIGINQGKAHVHD